MSGILLAVDPGLLHPAAALFDNGELQKASRVKIPKGITTKTPILERCQAIALAILDYVNVIPDRGDIICTEYPQIYTQDKSKGDPNQLIPLACIGACLSGLCCNAKILSPKPKDWTGNVPKADSGDPWDSPRGQRIFSRLSVDERSRIIVSHDSLDSVGIGLWALGRFDRRRVYETG